MKWRKPKNRLPHSGGVLEKRDNTDRWEKQLVRLEGIIADLNAQLQEARSATVRR
jgi:hypothetical protein